MIFKTKLRLETMKVREIKFGEKTVQIRAVAPALLFYKQEFGSDLVGDMTKIINGYEAKEQKEEGDEEVQGVSHADFQALGNINFLSILQMAWAMAKADKFGKPFPKFASWLHEYGEDIDFSDEDLVLDVVEEATKGFFRKSAGIRGAFAGRK